MQHTGWPQHLTSHLQSTTNGHAYAATAAPAPAPTSSCNATCTCAAAGRHQHAQSNFNVLHSTHALAQAHSDNAHHSPHLTRTQDDALTIQWRAWCLWNRPVVQAHSLTHYGNLHVPKCPRAHMPCTEPMAAASIQALTLWCMPQAHASQARPLPHPMIHQLHNSHHGSPSAYIVQCS
jgi:hypothetical protein